MVYLTGAGPGDIELLTLKAYKIIQQADVIIYDRLANSDILELAKDGCEFIYVGKADKKHTLPQEQINEVLLQAAQKYDVVVRLKGGDPFVFGRGGEEGLYLAKYNIPFEVIPGISSAISVPAYAGIPVTHRGIATSFKVITGHRSKLSPCEIEWEHLKNDETLVFLMGFKHLDSIAKNLIAVGKPKDLPVATISKGTTKEQKVVIGTLENIAKRSKGLESPVLTIVGEVVNLHEQLQWFR